MYVRLISLYVSNITAMPMQLYGCCACFSVAGYTDRVPKKFCLAEYRKFSIDIKVLLSVKDLLYR